MRAESVLTQGEIFSLPEQRYIANQGKYVERFLKELNLESIRVKPQGEIRDVSHFKDKKIVAYRGIWDIPIAILAASGIPSTNHSDNQYQVVLIAPTKKGSGLLSNDENGTLWTDSFWICENGVFNYIKPTQPVHIDALDCSFDNPRPDLALWPFQRAQKRLSYIADDKQITREMLSRA